MLRVLLGRSQFNSVVVKHFHVTPLRFGITDAIYSGITNKVQAKKDDNFHKMVELMVGTPRWTLKAWQQQLDGQLSNWMTYLPGVSGSDDIKVLKGYKAILNAMTEAELEDPELLKMPAKQRISDATSKSIDEISAAITMYKQTKIVATWLKVRKKAGDPLPATEIELMQMQQNDPRMRDIARKIMFPGGKPLGRKRMQF